MKNMITAIERGIKSKSILVVGDFFLDKYIYMKDEETGKSLYLFGPAYKIEKTVCSPGAAGTVVKNFNVTDMLISVSDRNTPSYTMIMRD